jgi:hypothetical protein
MLAVLPVLVEYRESQTGGFKARAIVAHCRPRNGDFAIGDQFATPFSGAESLRLQDTIQGHFAHDGTVPEAGGRFFIIDDIIVDNNAISDFSEF